MRAALEAANEKALTYIANTSKGDVTVLEMDDWKPYPGVPWWAAVEYIEDGRGELLHVAAEALPPAGKCWLRAGRPSQPMTHLDPGEDWGVVR